MLVQSLIGKNNFLYRVQILFFVCLFVGSSCSAQKQLSNSQALLTGAAQLNQYLPLLQNKTVALVANHTSLVDDVHLLDTLLASGINVNKVFAPEHGFRGDADAGAHIKDGLDSKTGLPLISLYGKNKKPSSEQLAEVEVIVFDIQDVGARFYTYLSTLHYVMEAAAEQGIPVVVLDRPNPNINIIDGPVLDTAFSSFVGLHPVPIVYGMTIGEYAQMINGEHWIKPSNKKTCELRIVKLANYTRKTNYVLPMAPSPNLKSDKAIHWYPTLCLFEGTQISVGRGTDDPFTMFGCPECNLTDTTFTPQPNVGASNPKYNGKPCAGIVMPNSYPDSLVLEYWLQAYASYTGEKPFFNSFLKKLAGTDVLAKQIASGASSADIRASWKKELSQFKKMRKPYLIYKF